MCNEQCFSMKRLFGMTKTAFNQRNLAKQKCTGTYVLFVSVENIFWSLVSQKMFYLINGKQA